MSPDVFDNPSGEWPALPPNFWRSYVTPRVVEYAYTSHSCGRGFNADGMWDELLTADAA